MLHVNVYHTNMVFMFRAAVSAELAAGFTNRTFMDGSEQISALWVDFVEVMEPPKQTK